MGISMFQAILLGIFACLASLPGMGGTTVGNYTLGRPLVGGLFVGLIMGDIQTGIIVGAAIQLVYIALVTPGGTVSADVRAVTYIGIPLAILAIRAQGLDPSSEAASGLAASLGAAVGTLGTVLFYGTATLNLVWQGIGWKAMDGGNWNTIKKTIPMVDFVFPWISHIVGSLLPAVGIAILCKQVVQKPLDWVTFAFGFILAAVMGCNLIASAVIAVFFALINFKIEQLKLARPAIAAAGAAFDDEEEEDI